MNVETSKADNGVNVAALLGARDALSQAPEAARFKWRATSHWVTHALLRDFGAVPVDERVVWDGKLVTGAGVSAGLDLGLAVVARLRDKPYAQGVQLLAEYAPQPPFNAGTPKTMRAARTTPASDTAAYSGEREARRPTVISMRAT